MNPNGRLVRSLGTALTVMMLKSRPVPENRPKIYVVPGLMNQQVVQEFAVSTPNTSFAVRIPWISVRNCVNHHEPMRRFSSIEPIIFTV